MAGNPSYTVSTAQQYIGRAPQRTLRKTAQRVVQRPSRPLTQEQSSVEQRGSTSTNDTFYTPRSQPEPSQSRVASSVELATSEAEDQERKRVQEVLKIAHFPLTPESAENSLLVEAIRREEETEADELANWGEELLRPYSGAELSGPGSRQSVWDEQLKAPVMFAPQLTHGPERKAEIVVLAPTARSGSKKGRLATDSEDEDDEQEEVVKLAPFSYSPGLLPEIIDLGQAKTTTKAVNRLPRLTTLTPEAIAAQAQDSRSKVHFAPQTPTNVDHSVPDVDSAYEYIEAPGAEATSASRKGHTPNSSAGTEIYFSPIDVNTGQVFLSSPQPSPPNSPEGASEAQKSLEIPRSVPDIVKAEDAPAESNARSEPALSVQSATAQLQELVLDAERGSKDEKVTLSLQQVDQLSVALARSPLIVRQVQKRFFDPRRIGAKTFSTAGSISTLSEASTVVQAAGALPPTPPSSERSDSDEVGGLALLDAHKAGAPVRCSSNPSWKRGKRTQLTLPPDAAHSAGLRVEPALHPTGESRIVLQILESVIDRKSGMPAFTLLGETDVSHLFIRTALTEVANAKGVTLDDVEIQTPRAPTYPSTNDVRSSALSEQIDWTTLDNPTPPATSPTTPTSPSASLVTSLIDTFNTLTPETCTMETLTLLSTLSALRRHHHTFLLLQPTRYHEDGALAGLKVAYASQSLQERFGEPGSSIHADKVAGSATARPRGFFDLTGSKFRTAIVSGVAKHMSAGEEFEKLVDMVPHEAKRCRCRCVPLRKGAEDREVSMWVCMVGGEFDLTVY